MSHITMPAMLRLYVPGQRVSRAAAIASWYQDPWYMATLILASVLSIIATWYALNNHLILLWDDAHSHLQIARRVMDNVSPGLAQLGGVWLPLPHLAMLPFIWSGYLWSTGLAGSLVAMISYVVAGGTIFQIARRLTHDNLASFIGALIFLVNPNVLYLQSTPLSELILIATMTLACYYLLAWAQDDKTLQLIQAAAWTLLATLARYDGWALFLAMLVAVVIIGKMRQQSLARIQTNLLLFGTLGGIGIVLWFVWNAAIFGDVLYFQHSQFSSQAQQLPSIRAGLDVPYHNLVEAVRYYAIVCTQNVGPIIMLLGVVSVLVFLYRRSFTPEVIAALTLLVPFAFYVISLYGGQAIIFAPGAGPNIAVPLYNVRYGVEMVAPMAAFIPTLISRPSRRAMAAPGTSWLARMGAFVSQLMPPLIGNTGSIGLVLVSWALIAQTILTMFGGVITVQEGRFGVDCFHYSPVPAFMAKHYNGGLILDDPFFDLQDISAANIDFKQIVYEGSGPLWTHALLDPAAVVSWVMVRPGDIIAQHIDTASAPFTTEFTLVARDPKSGVEIFHRAGLAPLPSRPVAPDLQLNYYSQCG